MYKQSNGFIGCGNERLIIESRFSKNDDDYFFQYLLEKVLDIPNIVDLNTDTNRDRQLLNLLLFLFPMYLKNAMRKGLYKKYIKHEYNDANVKGTIDVARHFRLNSPFIGKIAYHQREFSYDNSLMELVRHTIEYIKGKPQGKTILSRAKEEIRLVIEATPSYKYYDRTKIINQNKKNPIAHAYYKEYRNLQRLCLLILQHQKTSIGSGLKQIYGIIFDGAWLWEEYLNTLVSDYFYHPQNKGHKGAQRLFKVSDENSKIGLIYPDFIGKNVNHRLIADAKYKPMKNIGRDDYQQVLSYMFRFDAKEGYYFYPFNENDKDEGPYKQLLLLSGSTYENNVRLREDEISLTKHGLEIPLDANSYEDFVSKIKNSESNFLSKIII